jgi:2,4-dienoyl-CoA reductase (NADPH2)
VDGLCKPYHLIGGADVASELDAKRAIDQATRLALKI